MVSVQEERRLSRRGLARGVAWSTPIVLTGTAAPAFAASTAQQCWTGNMTGTVDWSWERSTTTVTLDQGTWNRYDFVATIINTWADSTLSELHYVVPWVWTGPLLSAQSGPWVAATWHDATSRWLSNRTESQGRRVFLATYGNTAEAPLVDFLPYTTMPFYPLSGTSSGSTGVEASHSLDAQVYAIPVLTPPAYGETATIAFSMLVEYTSSSALMETAFWGALMGTGCVPV